MLYFENMIRRGIVTSKHNVLGIWIGRCMRECVIDEYLCECLYYDFT